MEDKYDVLSVTHLGRKIQGLVEDTVIIRRTTLIAMGRESRVTHAEESEAWTAIADAIVKLALPPKEGV